MMYAVRHKATGNFLPAELRGASQWKGEAGKSPRLFNIRGAKTFIAQWAMGIHRSENHEDGFDTWEVRKIYDQGRKRDDLEIIPVTLIFGEPL